MTDTPKSPEFPHVPDPETAEAVPEFPPPRVSPEATSASLETTALNYELDISPGLKATVEVENVPETYFDKRHETLDGSPAAKGMVPIGQVILQTPPTKRQASNSLASTSPSPVQPQTGPLVAPWHSKGYRRAMLRGALTGCAVTAVIVYFVLAK